MQNNLQLIHGRFGSTAVRGPIEIKLSAFGAITIKHGQGEVLSVSPQRLIVNDLGRTE